MCDYRLLFRGDYSKALINKLDDYSGYISFNIPNGTFIIMGDIPCYYRNSQISLKEYGIKKDTFFVDKERFPILCVLRDVINDKQYTFRVINQKVTGNNFIIFYDNRDSCKSYNISKLPNFFYSGSLLLYGDSDINMSCLIMGLQTCPPCDYPSVKN